MMKYIQLILILASAVWGALHTNITNQYLSAKFSDIDTHPYVVSIQLIGQHVCGGTIISPIWVVSAAHCFTGSNAEFVASCTVRAGSSFQALGGEVIHVSRIITHEDYNGDTQDYDIALVQLSKPITTPKASSIGVAAHGKVPPAKTNATVSGWGQFYLGGPYSPVLKSMEISIVNKTHCLDYYKSGILTITEGMICAKDSKTRQSFCPGDSGGPLITNGVLTGIVSKSGDCYIKGSPGVYTSVPHVRMWIREKTDV